MKAIVWTGYGPPEVLKPRDIELPAVGESQMLVRIHAASVTAGDVEMRRLNQLSVLTLPLRLYFGLFKPRGTRVLGQEFAGIVTDIGGVVSKFSVGDRVTGHAGLKFGGYAEYGILSEKDLVTIVPSDVSLEEACTFPTAGVYAVYFVRAAGVQHDQAVLVNGGGGAIGSVAIQLAKLAGAHVTGVDRSDKLELMRGLGADEVIDYQTEDFTRRTETYDAILDVIDKSWFGKAAPALKPGGVYCHTSTSPIRALRSRLSRHRKTRRTTFVPGANDAADLDYLIELVRSGSLEVITDSVVPLQRLPDAHRHAETGAKKGNIVIRIGQSDE